MLLQDIAYGANYRSDGRLIVAGCEAPVRAFFSPRIRRLCEPRSSQTVYLFEASTKEMLRTYKCV